MGHKFLLKSDPIHPKPTDAGHDAGHDGHSLCFLDILGSAWKREPHHRDEILEPSWARSWWEAIPLRLRCDSAANGAGHWWHLNTLDVLLLRIHHAVGSRVLSVELSIEILCICLRFNSVWCTALQQRWWSAQVGSSWPSWGKDRAVRGRGEAGCTVFVFDAFVSSFPTLPCFLGIFSYIRYRWYSTSSAMSCF